jgi:hypothetical protein
MSPDNGLSQLFVKACLMSDKGEIGKRVEGNVFAQTIDRMGLKVSCIKIIAGLYLFVPIVIFAVNWVSLPISLPLVLVASLVLAKFSVMEIRQKDDPAIGIWAIAGTLFVAIVWVGVSGIGGFCFQNWDFHFRNAVLRDLISYSWPVHYPDGRFLVYYFTYWLPAALCGKVFGWEAANICLFAWSVLGVWITLVLFALNVGRRRFLLCILMFVFFSGADYLGDVLVSRSFYMLIGEHLEWWAGRLQYSSFTTQLFWVFNQAVPAWIATLLIIEGRNNNRCILAWAMMLAYAPFPFIGAVPILAYSVFFANPKQLKSVGTRIRELLNPSLALGTMFAFVIILLYLPFFLLNDDGVGAEFLFNKFKLSTVLNYVEFCVFEFGILVWLVRNKQGGVHRTEAYLAGGILALIPLIKMGSSNDFCMRASIPALVVLAVVVARCFKEAPTRLRTILLAFFVCLGAITPMQEMLRSVKAVIMHKTLISDEIVSFANKGNVKIFENKRNNFVGKPPAGTVYGKYFLPSGLDEK